MDTPGYVILSRLGSQLRGSAVLANNLANANTPGYQAQRAIFARYLQTDPLAQAPPGGRSVTYSIDRATWRDTVPGPLTTTSNPLDVAIRGEGFFAVETPRGERFTRAGRFTLDQTGKLVDAEGNAVLDERGSPITFAPGDSRIEIQGDGTIRSENGVVGRLRVIRFEDPQRLRPEGDRLFAAEEDPQPVARPHLVQGAMEGSNVRPVLEMVRMTEELREFQLAAQFAEREGERLQTAVDRILRRRS
ncbi:flagellar basal-body rod protein FlgF [Siccirubricoccus deserti]|uniref:Flagellar basal-body rod protein FlgF n=1 Tax=Siccirubricoccus deserti TaxID=2013562 RepID=A0A9X0UEU6_9PROT|nr:flagellar basal-body rod protein FlgF [Siccirubricoccus deserti]MBC4018294.1 flagellar basal-body rod protein FlgF [Siccirubricoccus deserti]GGC64229.1 flagellar basal-body rod protein FlgF [Siccirubricoccus deserti]